MMTRLPIDRDDINITGLVKGDERWLFIWTEDNRANVLRTLGRFASNPDLAFNWYDAALLSQRIRQTECCGR